MTRKGKWQAHKGCYLLVGQKPQSHDEYLVNQYVSIGKAKKAATNQARQAPGDDFFIYDDTGACCHQISFADLPTALQPAPSRSYHPDEVPPVRPFSLRRLLPGAAAAVTLLGLWFGLSEWRAFLDRQPISPEQRTDYLTMHKAFGAYNFPHSCYDQDWQHYTLLLSRYEQDLTSPTLPQNKREYLQDKLRFYEESRYRAPDIVPRLIDFARRELAEVQDGDIAQPTSPYIEQRANYLARIKAELPLRAALADYVQSWPKAPPDVITTDAYRRLKQALELCRTLASKTPLASFGYLLDGGSGKEIPLDGYEVHALDQMISSALAQRDISRADWLYQALIRYQMAYWDSHLDTVQTAITRYHAFLVEHALDPQPRAAYLVGQVADMTPYTYSQNYKDYSQRTIQFLQATLTRQP